MRPLYHQIHPVQTSLEQKVLYGQCLKRFIGDADPFIYIRAKRIDDVTVNVNYSFDAYVHAPFRKGLVKFTHSGPQHWIEVSGHLQAPVALSPSPR
jgi:hypothetical protein